MLSGTSCGVLLGLHSLVYLCERMIVQFAFRASSYEPGQPGWLGFQDLASALFFL